MSRLLTNIFTLAILIVLASCEGGGGGGEAGGGAGSSTSSNNNDNSNNNASTDSNIDPLYQYAWHLENTGQSTFSSSSGTSGIDIKVKNIIDGNIYGDGVKIAVSDSGIDYNHEDLSDNYTSGVSKNFLLSSPYNGHPATTSSSPDSHGTAVTGLISAVGWNNKGSRGVAPKSKFGGFNFIASGVTQSIDQTLYQMTGDFDIFNYSYGSSPYQYQSMGSNNTEKQSIIDAFETGVTTLRSSKGAIYVKSAGNEYLMTTSNYYGGSWQSYILGNSTLLETNNYPYTIIVGAIDATGFTTSYSSPGSNLWISAPGGEFGSSKPAILTTDITGCSEGSAKSSSGTNLFENNSNGLNTNCNYTSAMNGTSSAAPIVSGVIALMLEENPSLTWRDVKHILASTAYISDTNTGVINHPGSRNLSGHDYMHAWRQNTAGYWFHNYYGFGNVHAENAVNMAKNYSVNLGTYKQTLNPSGDSWLYDSGTISQAIPDNSSTGTTSTLNLKHNYIIESVQIRVSVTHGVAENLGIELTSPSGTVSKLVTINSGILDYHFNDTLFTSNAFYGEESKGVWTIKVVDGSNANPDGTSGTSGTLTNWKLNVMGHKPVNPSDSTAPNAITSLAMTNYGNSLTSSPSFTFTNSGSGDVLRYEYCIGTNASNCSVADWVILAGTSPFSISDLSLTNGNQYYLNVRVIDESENISPVESVSWTVDNVAPSDVAGLSLSSTSYGSDTQTPTASWTTVSDADLSHYEYVITGPNSTVNEITSGTINKNDTSIQVSSITLPYSHTYYFKIRAVDNAGNVSNYASADFITSKGTWQYFGTMGTGRRAFASVEMGDKIGYMSGFASSGNDPGNGLIYDTVGNTYVSIPSYPGTLSTRLDNKIIWTGTELITFGGLNFQTTTRVRGEGFRYNPSTDSAWTQISSTNAPTARNGANIVWTGTEMLVWGGDCHSGTYCSSSQRSQIAQSGARYNPSTNSWTTMSTTNAPYNAGESMSSSLSSQTTKGIGVWSGSEFISVSNNGNTNVLIKKYNPSSNSWTNLTAPSFSIKLSSKYVWTGSKLIIFSQRDSASISYGGIYDYSADSWTEIVPDTTLGSPHVSLAAIKDSEAVWTGTEVILIGGGMNNCEGFSAGRYKGVRYNPTSGKWNLLNNVNAPFGQHGSQANWINGKLYVYGGCKKDSSNNNESLNGLSSYTFNP